MSMNKKLKTIAMSASAASLLAVSSAQADVLAEYLFTTDGSSSDTNIASNAGSFTNNFTNGTSSGVSGGGDNFFIGANENSSTTIAEALGNTGFASFTIEAANAGESIFLTSLTYDHESDPNGTIDLTTNLILTSSLDGFASAINVSTVNSPDGTGDVTEAITVDLSGSTFQNIATSGSAVEFRLFQFDTSSGSNQRTRIDTIVLNGTVAPSTIPEPAHYVSLLGLSIALIAIRRRNRK